MSCFFSVGVCSAVELTTKHSRNTFLVGTSFYLRCKCYMNPAGTYAFVKDGSAVITDSRVTTERNKLHINNATKSDSGSYSCAATSVDSSQTINSAGDLSISVVGKYMILFSISLDLSAPGTFFVICNLAYFGKILSFNLRTQGWLLFCTYKILSWKHNMFPCPPLKNKAFIWEQKNNYYLCCVYDILVCSQGISQSSWNVPL